MVIKLTVLMYVGAETIPHISGSPLKVGTGILGSLAWVKVDDPVKRVVMVLPMLCGSDLVSVRESFNILLEKD